MDPCGASWARRFEPACHLALLVERPLLLMIAATHASRVHAAGQQQCAESRLESQPWQPIERKVSSQPAPKTPPATQEPDVETGARTVDTRAMGRGPPD